MFPTLRPSAQPCAGPAGLLCDQRDDRPEEHPISASRTTLIAAGCAAVLLAGTTTACGTVEHLSAARKAGNALAKLGEQRSLTMEISLRGDSSGLLASAASGGAPGGLPKGAKALMTFHARKPIAEAAADDMISTSVRFTSTKGTLTEYRVIGDDAYHRMDPEVAYGPEETARMRAFYADSPMADVMEGYLAGGWVHTTAPARPQGGAEDPQARGELLDVLRDVAASEVRFRDAGHHDGAEVIAAEASPRGLVTALVEQLGDLDGAGALAGALGGQVPALGEANVSEEKLAELPDDVVTLDLAVRHGVLTGLSLDLTQFDLGDAVEAHSEGDAQEEPRSHEEPGSEESGHEEAPEELSLDIRFGEARHRTVAPEDAQEMPTQPTSAAV
ncbi:hypothetical protein [Streptomyces sp. NPDC060194]|uniref:hypothetical protein n=1 Tax=Streptomyces sp. NPDC060194 TaxID=3347069 RepID=UPI0036584037